PMLSLHALAHCHALSFAASLRVDGRALAPKDAVRQAQFEDPQWPDDCREVLLRWQCCVSHYVRRTWTSRRCRSMTSRASFEHDVTCLVCPYRLGDV